MVAVYRARARIRYTKRMTLDAPLRRKRPNPVTLRIMAKRKAAAETPHRRPRGEIDRNYFFGDVLIKTGVALAIVLGMVALYTPVSLMGAINDGAYDYIAVMGIFGFISIATFLTGRHLRREATHWEFD